ncbi:hypothetical protein [Ectothiorhodospira shaposhnikovii]|uniref:hypothetical protein n=1 Tax=Ectothiorhodospira shaposhnikovii TaxID=1054 RepID=UPI001F5B63B7|nr:hypothetical protein [Ectothiorhodospira shaposhnikovii]
MFYNTSTWTLKQLHSTATNNPHTLLANVDEYLGGFSDNVKEIIAADYGQSIEIGTTIRLCSFKHACQGNLCMASQWLKEPAQVIYTYQSAAHGLPGPPPKIQSPLKDVRYMASSNRRLSATLRTGDKRLCVMFY